MRAYLAGPRTGIADYNRAEFINAATHLRGTGWQILSPVELDDPEDGMESGAAGDVLPDDVYLPGLEKCLAAMLAARVDAVIVLPGWEDSRGARLEVETAHGLGKSILRYPDLAPAVPARHPSSARYHEIIRSWAELHDRKQADYGRGNDPFANVRASEDFGIPGWIGTAVRMNDKMKRLQTAAAQYLRTGRVNLANEGVIDAFDDLGVYAGIGRVLFEEAATE